MNPHVLNSATQVRRGELSIIRDILRVLLVQGYAPKTRILNMANLNPNTFNRYMSLLEYLGVVAVEESSGGKRSFRATAKSWSLFMLLEQLLSGVGRREERTRSILADVLALASEKGSVYEMASINLGDVHVFFDASLRVGNCTVFVDVMDRWDPLIAVKPVLLASRLDMSRFKYLIVVSDEAVRTLSSVYGGSVRVVSVSEVLSEGISGGFCT